MLRLQTLGPIELRAESGGDLHPVLAQPKRLGLLIYLAVEAPDRFLRRDQLLALFWPELDDTQARQALRAALYFLRQHLGDQVLTSRGADEIGCSNAALRTDATEFRQATERGEAETALALYQGAFLAGFHIPESSPELDQWISQVRSDLRHRAAGLAWSLAEQAERERNQVGAAHWGRRAQGIEADDEVALRRLMELLDRSGDPGGAVRACDEFAARLKAELGVDPSAETRALVDRLRARRAPPVRATAAGAGEGTVQPAGGSTPAPPVARPASRRWPALMGFAAALLLIALVALARRKDLSGALTGPVVVAPLRNETGDTALAIWGRYAGDWITQGMERVGRLPVVPWASALRASRFADSLAQVSHSDPVAVLGREAAAGTVITGSYYKLNDRYRFRAEVSDPHTGRLLFTVPDVSAGGDSIEAAVRELRDRLMGGIGLASDPRYRGTIRFGQRPPRFAAFEAYDRGSTLFQDSKYTAATPELERAFGLDSSFIAPALVAATAYVNQSEYPEADSLVRAVRARRDELTAAQELSVTFLEAKIRGDGAGALDALRRLSQVAPSLATSYNVALSAIFLNRPHEALAALGTIDRAALQVSRWAPYWIYLAHANHLTGHHTDERRAVRELRVRYPERSVGLVLEAMSLGAEGRTAALDSIFADDHSSPNTYWSTGAAYVMAGEELVAHGHEALARPWFDRGIEWLVAQRKADPKNRYHRDWLCTAYYQVGHWDAARPLADSLVADFPDRTPYRMMAALLAARRGDTLAAERALGPAPAARTGSWLGARARIAAALGQGDRAVDLLTQGLALGILEFQFDHADWYVDFRGLMGDPRIRRLLMEGLDREQ